MNNISHDAHKWCIVIIRYMPAVAALLMLIHVVALTLGKYLVYTEFLVDSSIINLIVYLMVSYAFGFCIWHRMLIGYIWFVSVCIDYQRTYGFGDLLTPMRIFVIVTGVALLYLFCAHCKNCKPRIEV